SVQHSHVGAHWHRAPHTAHLYRTVANGSVLHRATAIRSGATGASTLEGTAESTAQSRPLLYTGGGVLPYDSAPASTFGAHGLRRVWLAGLFESQRVVCSTELVRGEAPGFPASPTHWLDFPEPVTGLTCVEDTLLVFTANSIWAVSGDGPAENGSGAFPPPRRLSTDVGCVDWRSVLTTSIGVFYQSATGLML